MLLFTRAELIAQFTASEISKAQSIRREGKIKALTASEDGSRASGRVRGTQGNVYEQVMRVTRVGRALKIEGVCSCPVGFECKHVLALLLELVDRQPVPEKAVKPAPLPEKIPPSSVKPAPVPVSQSVGASSLGSVSSPRRLEVLRVPAALSQPPAQTSIQSIELPEALQNWLIGTEKTLENLNKSAKNGQELHFVLGLKSSPHQPTRLTLKLSSARVLQDGSLGGVKPYPLPRSLDNLAVVAQQDFELLRLLQACLGTGSFDGLYEITDVGLAQELLERLLDTDRLHWGRLEGEVLRRGEPRAAQAGWQSDPLGVQRPTLIMDLILEGAQNGPLEPVMVALPLTPAWYVDSDALRLGRVDTKLSAALLRALWQCPPVAPGVSEGLARALEPYSDLHFPAPTVVRTQRKKGTLERKITFYSELQRSHSSINSGYGQEAFLDSAEVTLGYDGQKVQSAAGAAPSQYRDGTLYRLERDLGAEKKAMALLESLNLRPIQKVYKNVYIPPVRQSHWTLPETMGEAQRQAWLRFVAHSIPVLREAGWEVELSDSFRFNVSTPESWWGGIEQTEHDWFGLELGVMVGGEKVNLLPLLADTLRTLTPESLLEMRDDEQIFVPLSGGKLLALPMDRIRPLLGVLVELYGQQRGEAKLRLNRLDAVRLAQLEAGMQLRWWGGEKLLELGRNLREFRGIVAVKPSKKLCAEMRPYQLEGLSWLGFLRQNDLNGILADDMGLGKTLQALAHLQLEKESGRSRGKTSLVVAPTSLMSNWRSEAEKFTPNLKTLVLHGKERAADFAKLSQFDVVFTTYPLALRDLSQLKKFDFHYLILDEAQNVKNSRSSTAQAISSLKAKHRLCLTGTPLENHLGELWSLFHFLMPGFLGDAERFRKLYRNPIEKGGDLERRDALAARVRPFLLRRRKQEVATELPPKTEMVVKLELEGPQRDLYETLRVSLSERVREEISKKGLERSHIMVLDALLKLRQVCCDPRLVKLTEARKVQVSAKLEWLRETLPEMVGEGRRVLIFSQFATLLGLLEETLKESGIPYSKLTGETKDRPAQIDAFQSGSTHVFLISLKAGGVGLNLTAADTVIHYDPWWNPAAENQATDRAHRIGQDKPVFVYKLIAEGSLEERILQMQQGKADLARGILEGDAGASSKITAEDLQALFAPLEGGETERRTVKA